MSRRTKAEQAEYDGWDSWDATYLDRTYGGAPDECSYHFIHLAEIVKMEKGVCPKQAEHSHS